MVKSLIIIPSLCACYYLSLLVVLAGEVKPINCTYNTYKWNVNLKKAIYFERVKRPYTDISTTEIDPLTGCTVCEEDQEIIDIPPLKPFKACNKIAPKLKKTLYHIIDSGEPVYEITGYRVGKTRGETDSEGNRTVFSNHSFGVAIDINAKQNGLYDECIEFGEHCHLVKGGPWLPGRPGSHTIEGVTVRAMKSAGFKWGGEIEGKQKDFMHFSFTGY